MGKAGWPSVHVGQFRAKKRGSSKHYSQWMFEAQTTMPCFHDIFERSRTDMDGDPTGRRGYSAARARIEMAGQVHLKSCRKCKENLESRRGK